MFSTNRLSLSERACCNNIKSDELCTNCKRDINLSEAHLYEYWVEPILVKSFKDGISLKCNSFLKDKS